MIRPIKLDKAYKITAEGKLRKDLKAIEAKLDVSTRLKRKKSKKIRVKKK